LITKTLIRGVSTPDKDKENTLEMTSLYNSGFSDFSPNGVFKIHRIIFGDVYGMGG
jgi:fido (protein-threonine AMPylation protein)